MKLHKILNKLNNETVFVSISAIIITIIMIIGFVSSEKIDTSIAKVSDPETVYQSDIAEENNTPSSETSDTLPAPIAKTEEVTDNSTPDITSAGMTAGTVAATKKSDPVKKTSAPKTATKTSAAAPPKTTPPATSSEFPYQIYVSKKSYTFAILGLDSSGKYTKVIRTFTTGVGRTNALTRTGTYKITGKERWHKWNTTSFSPYASKISSGVWFHGPLFSDKTTNSMKTYSYNEIGTACTSGCMRTVSEGAAWVYNNCAIGTTVVIANDSKYTSTKIAKLSSSQKYDPTEPGEKTEILISSFTLNKASVTLNVNEAFALSITAKVPSNASTKKFIYSSSNKNVATVDANGNIKAVGAGTATISVTADDTGSAVKNCMVTVNKPAQTTTQASTQTPIKVPPITQE